MKFSFISLFVLLVGLNGCATKGDTPAKKVQHSGTGALVIKPIIFKKDAYIRDAVKKECRLQEKLIQFIEQFSADQYARIITDSSRVPAGAQILSIQIEQVQGASGGAWSGGKMVMIKGKLTRKGKVLGDFKASRYSGGGMFAAYKGTCAILGRCVKTLGKDVAKWLENPTSQAALGNM